MARTPIWKSICTALEAEIGAGHYAPGSKLPTEAALASRFGVNRHTVRRALGDMADRGLVRARRGSGVFVAAVPTDYPIGRRTRFHQNIAATGRLAEKKILRIETRPADVHEAHALRIAAGDPVVVFEGLSLVEGTVVAQFESAFPAQRLPGLAEALAAFASVTRALEEVGVPDYLRAETRLTAVAATTTQALHLGLKEGDPLLRSVAVNTTPDGDPLEYGRTWFVGDRVTLTVTSN